MIPVDLKRSQAEVPGNGPFTLGGPIGNPKRGYRVRCSQEPTVIATEKKPGSDGLRGSMSLCASCRDATVKQLGTEFAEFEPIGQKGS